MPHIEHLSLRATAFEHYDMCRGTVGVHQERVHDTGSASIMRFSLSGPRGTSSGRDPPPAVSAHDGRSARSQQDGAKRGGNDRSGLGDAADAVVGKRGERREKGRRKQTQFADERRSRAT